MSLLGCFLPQGPPCGKFASLAESSSFTRLFFSIRKCVNLSRHPSFPPFHECPTVSEVISPPAPPATVDGLVRSFACIFSPLFLTIFPYCGRQARGFPAKHMQPPSFSPPLRSSTQSRILSGRPDFGWQLTPSLENSLFPHVPFEVT